MNEWLVVLVMMVTFLFFGGCLVVIGFGIWWGIQKVKISMFGEPPAIRRT